MGFIRMCGLGSVPTCEFKVGIPNFRDAISHDGTITHVCTNYGRCEHVRARLEVVEAKNIYADTPAEFQAAVRALDSYTLQNVPQSGQQISELRSYFEGWGTKK